MRHVRHPKFDEYFFADGTRLQFFAPQLWQFGVRVLKDDLFTTIALPTMSIRVHN